MARKRVNSETIAWFAVVGLWIVSLGGFAVGAGYSKCVREFSVLGGRCYGNWADELIGPALVGMLVALATTVVFAVHRRRRPSTGRPLAIATVFALTGVVTLLVVSASLGVEPEPRPFGLPPEVSVECAFGSHEYIGYPIPGRRAALLRTLDECGSRRAWLYTAHLYRRGVIEVGYVPERDARRYIRTIEAFTGRRFAPREESAFAFFRSPAYPRVAKRMLNAICARDVARLRRTCRR